MTPSPHSQFSSKITLVISSKTLISNESRNSLSSFGELMTPESLRTDSMGSRRKSHLPCLSKAKVLSVLKEMNDDPGHWTKSDTMTRQEFNAIELTKLFIERELLGVRTTWACDALTTTSTRTSNVPFPTDGNGFYWSALKTAAAGNTFILILWCYMSWFEVPFAWKISNDEDILGAVLGLSNHWQTTAWGILHWTPEKWWEKNLRWSHTDKIEFDWRQERIALPIFPRANCVPNHLLELLPSSCAPPLIPSLCRRWPAVGQVTCDTSSGDLMKRRNQSGTSSSSADSLDFHETGKEEDKKISEKIRYCWPSERKELPKLHLE